MEDENTYKLEWTPALLQRLDDQEFQKVVAELFRRLGYHVDIVGTGGPDKGVDIFAEKKIPVKEVLAIQCKRQEKAVTVEKIREYSALYNLHDVNSVVVVTSSTFTTPAREESERLKVRLMDGVELCQLLQQYLADLLPQLEESVAPQAQELQRPAPPTKQVQEPRKPTPVLVKLLFLLLLLLLPFRMLTQVLVKPKVSFIFSFILGWVLLLSSVVMTSFTLLLLAIGCFYISWRSYKAYEKYRQL